MKKTFLIAIGFVVVIFIAGNIVAVTRAQGNESVSMQLPVIENTQMKLKAQVTPEVLTKDKSVPMQVETNLPYFMVKEKNNWSKPVNNVFKWNTCGNESEMNGSYTEAKVNVVNLQYELQKALIGEGWKSDLCNTISGTSVMTMGYTKGNQKLIYSLDKNDNVLKVYYKL